jgi:hypothetical protein
VMEWAAVQSCPCRVFPTGRLCAWSTPGPSTSWLGTSYRSAYCRWPGRFRPSGRRTTGRQETSSWRRRGRNGRLGRCGPGGCGYGLVLKLEQQKGPSTALYIHSFLDSQESYPMHAGSTSFFRPPSALPLCRPVSTMDGVLVVKH